MARIDEVDRKIISLLTTNPEMSQSEISEFLGISQPAVGARVRKLKDEGIINHFVGVNLKKSGLFLVKVDIETRESQRILDFFKECPLYANGLVTSGKRNLCLFLLGENMRSIVACIDKHIRGNPDIIDIELNFVITPIKDIVLPLTMEKEKKHITPCGEKCLECSYYMLDRCLGCPRTVAYKGTLL